MTFPTVPVKVRSINKGESVPLKWRFFFCWYQITKTKEADCWWFRKIGWWIIPNKYIKYKVLYVFQMACRNYELLAVSANFWLPRCWRFFNRTNQPTRCAFLKNVCFLLTTTCCWWIFLGTAGRNPVCFSHPNCWNQICEWNKAWKCILHSLARVTIHYKDSYWPSVYISVMACHQGFEHCKQPKLFLILLNHNWSDERSYL